MDLKLFKNTEKIENNAVLLFGKLDGLKHKKSIVKHYQTLFIYFMMIVIDKMHKHI